MGIDPVAPRGPGRGGSGRLGARPRAGERRAEQRRRRRGVSVRREDPEQGSSGVVRGRAGGGGGHVGGREAWVRVFLGREPWALILY